MKLHVLFALLSACLVACGGSSTQAASTGSGSDAHVTDPSKLPDDEAGLTKVYKSLFTDLVETMEGIDTEEQLNTALGKVKEMGPAFEALMKRSEELNIGLDEGISADASALQERMSAAMKSVMEKFPTKAMDIMNAFQGAMGDVAPK